MLIKGLLSLFVGAMVAVLLVCSIVGCTTDFAAEQPQKTPGDAAKLTNSRINSTKNKGGNGNLRPPQHQVEYKSSSLLIIEFVSLIGAEAGDLRYYIISCEAF